MGFEIHHVNTPMLFLDCASFSVWGATYLMVTHGTQLTLYSVRDCDDTFAEANSLFDVVHSTSSDLKTNITLREVIERTNTCECNSLVIGPENISLLTISFTRAVGAASPAVKMALKDIDSGVKGPVKIVDDRVGGNTFIFGPDEFVAVIFKSGDGSASEDGVLPGLISKTKRIKSNTQTNPLVSPSQNCLGKHIPKDTPEVRVVRYSDISFFHVISSFMHSTSIYSLVASYSRRLLLELSVLKPFLKSSRHKEVRISGGDFSVEDVEYIFETPSKRIMVYFDGRLEEILGDGGISNLKPVNSLKQSAFNLNLTKQDKNTRSVQRKSAVSYLKVPKGKIMFTKNILDFSLIFMQGGDIYIFDETVLRELKLKDCNLNATITGAELISPVSPKNKTISNRKLLCVLFSKAVSFIIEIDITASSITVLSTISSRLDFVTHTHENVVYSIGGVRQQIESKIVCNLECIEGPSPRNIMEESCFSGCSIFFLYKDSDFRIVSYDTFSLLNDLPIPRISRCCKKDSFLEIDDGKYAIKINKPKHGNLKENHDPNGTLNANTNVLLFTVFRSVEGKKIINDYLDIESLHGWILENIGKPDMKELDGSQSSLISLNDSIPWGKFDSFNMNSLYTDGLHVRSFNSTLPSTPIYSSNFIVNASSFRNSIVASTDVGTVLVQSRKEYLLVETNGCLIHSTCSFEYNNELFVVNDKIYKVYILEELYRSKKIVTNNYFNYLPLKTSGNALHVSKRIIIVNDRVLKVFTISKKMLISIELKESPQYIAGNEDLMVIIYFRSVDVYRTEDFIRKKHRHIAKDESHICISAFDHLLLNSFPIPHILVRNAILIKNQLIINSAENIQKIYNDIWVNSGIREKSIDVSEINEWAEYIFQKQRYFNNNNYVDFLEADDNKSQRTKGITPFKPRNIPCNTVFHHEFITTIAYLGRRLNYSNDTIEISNTMYDPMTDEISLDTGKYKYNKLIDKRENGFGNEIICGGEKRELRFESPEEKEDLKMSSDLFVFLKSLKWKENISYVYSCNDRLYVFGENGSVHVISPSVIMS